MDRQQIVRCPEVAEDSGSVPFTSLVIMERLICDRRDKLASQQPFHS